MIIADDGENANNLAYFDFTINISSVNDPVQTIESLIEYNYD